MTPAGPAHRQRHTCRRLAIIAVAVSAVLVASVDVFVVTQRNRTTPVSFQDVVRRYHAGVAARPPLESSTATTAMVAQTTSASSPARSTESPTPRFAMTPGAPYALPPEGVYRYRTHGRETISVLAATHTYPDETYWTVRHHGGCGWQLERDLLKEHTEWATYCSQLHQFLFLEEKRQISFFGQTDSDDLRCNPPAVFHDTEEVPGEAVLATCTDGRDTARVDFTDVGLQPMLIDGTRIDSVHVKAHATIRGRANGETHEEYWLSPDTGLTLHEIRSVDAEATATFGVNIHYHEDAEFVLESLTPTT